MLILIGCDYDESTPIKISQKNKTQIDEPKIILATSTVDYDLLPEIKKAQALLYKAKAGYTIKTEDHFEKIKVVPKIIKAKTKAKHKKLRPAKPKYIIRHWQTKYLADFNILLAIQNTKAKVKTIETIKLTDKGAKAPAGFAVNFLKANGVNTEFTISYPEGYVVLAIRRVVQKGTDWEEAVYTPYTKELNQASLQKAGLDYLKYRFGQAKWNLRSLKVESKAFGGLIAEVIPDTVSLVLAIIEHIDPSRFQNGIAIEQLVNEVLVIIGANQSMAYVYSVSPAGARGLFQFIEKTYLSIVARYPLAKLEPNFIKGMNNHFNAAKASLLLFDADLSFISLEHRESIRPYPLTLGKYLAAAYNGGAGRALEAIKTYGQNWETNLRPETVIYLQKFQAVWDYLKKK